MVTKDKMNKEKHQFYKEILAIVFINFLAILYDSTYIMIALAVDTMLLGFSLNKFNLPINENIDKKE